MAQPTAVQETEHSCVQCDKPTNLRCKGCDEGVDKYGVQVLTFYCSKECQITHRSTHKSECRNANYRKQLYRTALLAKDIFFGVRKMVYMYNIQGAVKKDGIIHLDMGSYQCPSVVYDFPGDLFASVEDQEAVLAHWSGPEALMKMHKFIFSALKATCTNIEALCVITEPGHDRVVGGPTEIEGGSMPHAVLKIDLKDGISYALDICAAQYGLPQVVSPWYDYCSLLVWEVKRSASFGGFGTDREKEDFLEQQRDVVGQSDGDYGQVVMLFHSNVVRLMYCAINTFMTKYDKGAVEMVTQERQQYEKDCVAFIAFIRKHVSLFVKTAKHAGVVTFMTSRQDLLNKYLENWAKVGAKIDATMKAKEESSQAQSTSVTYDWKWPEMVNAWHELEKAKEEPRFHMMEIAGGKGLVIWGDK